MNEGAFGGLILILFALACYFLPTIVACMRGKANGTGGVFFVNLLLGWTLIGWLVSFIWACSGQTMADKSREEDRHRELLAAMSTQTSPETFARLVTSSNERQQS